MDRHVPPNGRPKPQGEPVEKSSQQRSPNASGPGEVFSSGPQSHNAILASHGTNRGTTRVAKHPEKTLLKG